MPIQLILKNLDLESSGRQPPAAPECTIDMPPGVRDFKVLEDNTKLYFYELEPNSLKFEQPSDNRPFCSIFKIFSKFLPFQVNISPLGF